MIERLEILEAGFGQVERQLRLWRGAAGFLAVLGVLLLAPYPGKAQVLDNIPDRVAALENLLQPFSRSGSEVFLTGANLHIVNGAGGTWTANGLGNLIVGYNEARTDGLGLPRTGSHNVVVGRGHNYTQFGGLVAGFENSITGSSCSVTGGAHNTASGEFASVSGGHRNTASGHLSSISGGQVNTASGDWGASVSGGEFSTASGNASSVSGGAYHTASGDVSSVSGGVGNKASGKLSSISAGQGNTANGELSSVTGGEFNKADGRYSSVSGGAYNQATGELSSILGGVGMTMTGSLSHYP